MWVKFLALGNNNGNWPSLGIEPGTFRLPGQCSYHLTHVDSYIDRVWTLSESQWETEFMWSYWAEWLALQLASTLLLQIIHIFYRNISREFVWILITITECRRLARHLSYLLNHRLLYIHKKNIQNKRTSGTELVMLQIQCTLKLWVSGYRDI